MSGDNGFTPTQESILKLLSDGFYHTRQELLDCLNNPDAGRTHLNNTLTCLRRRLRPRGHDVVCTIQHKRVGYRLVRLLSTHGE